MWNMTDIIENVGKCLVMYFLNEFVISTLALILAVISIVLLIIVEYVRRPSLEFLQHKDEPGPEDEGRRSMWYHLKVRNEEPSKIFNRDAALRCRVRVDFLDKNTKKPLVLQITAHWVNKSEPRDYSTGRFDPSKIPECQIIDVGFRDEMFDILIKFEGEKSCFAADPWVVYDPLLRPNPWLDPGSSSYHQKWEKLRIDVDECVVRAEIEAINLGRRKVGEYILKNNGIRKEDVEISLSKNV